jgi:gliding motility-associated-like protein
MKKFTYSFVVLCLSLFFVTTSAQEYNGIIQDYLNKNTKELGVEAADVQQWFVESQLYSKTTQITHVHIKQKFQGIEIYNAMANFAIKDNKIFYVGNSLVDNISQKISNASFGLNAGQAILKALPQLEMNMPTESIQMLSSSDNKKYVYVARGASPENIHAKKVLQPTDDAIKAAWEITMYTNDYKHMWNVRVDGTTGQILAKNDWVLSCDFGESGFSKSDHDDHDDHKHVLDDCGNHFVEATTSASTAMVGSYRVFDMPLESPSHGAASLVANPDDPIASPFGWHDTDGSAGPEFTITRGNNVHAYQDANGNNNSSGDEPDGGAALLFDFNYPGTNVDPITYQEASVTNLFFWNNLMHDIWYQYGFDEASGNFQENNYGNGGIAGDYVVAEAQDGSGTNNANFSTPPDGGNGRMQMFLWTGAPATPGLLRINNTPLVGDYDALDNNFAPGNVPVPVAITADLALADDGVADNTNACEALTNGAAINGNIAVVRRGDCNFTGKVINAQNEGAVAVLVVNNVAGDITMGGGDAGVTIPAYSINQADGEAIITEMGNGTVNATFNPTPDFVALDGDFDNGIIAHEYGHGISIRLAGGPNNSGCLNNSDQMGEGWSDWFGLMLTIEPGDQASDIRGIGTFALGQPTDGNGIRPFPYSTDLAVNPFTYSSSNTVSVPHGVGSVWCTILWDLTWAYIDQYGYDPDLYNGTGGNNRIMQLVLDGIKLQPCSPGMVDGRDALIAADQATTGGTDTCMIWNVFAARGLGENASQGSTNNASDAADGFDVPAACDDPDIDNDGILNVDDNCPTTANPGQEDVDNDGIGDVCDNCVNTANPGQEDGDNDGVGDVCDNCPTIANPGQEDADANGTGDVCEDADSDGVFDSVDNCVNTPNPGQEDGDGDGIGDVCDNCPTVANPGQEDADANGTGDVCEDADSDGVFDSIDNCVNTPNPGQEDADNDGIGDVCDNCPNVANPGQEDVDADGTGDVCDDDDNDGVINSEDNCPDDPNTDQADNDNDGIGDVCDDDDDNDGVLDVDDNCPTDANPDQADDDNDGIGDICDPINNNDSDSDGILDVDDNCPDNPNADQSDIDQDGIGDVCDPVNDILVDVSNGFTPNGDTINDTWFIKNINFYPNASIRVFNRWGNEVYTSRGYNNDWNGETTEGGSGLLPVGSYYYVVNLNNPSFGEYGLSVFTGWVYINY